MIKKIVLTGGPGSGKTSSMAMIVKYFSNLGYNVVVVPETATELILGGLRPFGDGSVDMIDFQELVLKLQLAKEEIYEQGAKGLNKDTIIIYDRGIIDNRAYVREEEFREVLSRVSDDLSYDTLMNKYDAVIVLEGDPKYYQTENNKARSESVNMAMEQGKKTLRAWMGHKNLKVVLPRDNFEDKVKEIIDFISDELNIDKYVKQRKYLVDLDDMGIEELKSGVREDISQYYLISDDNVEKRIRKVETENRVSYYFSIFKLSDNGKQLISERIIDERLFKELLEFRDKDKKEIKKTRYISVIGGVRYTLDIFDDWKMGIVETSGNYLDRCYVIEDVTEFKEYQNRNIASEKIRKLVLK